MLDGASEESCGRCHEGSAARPEGVRFPAPGAPSCASCHEQGVLGCPTCHLEGPTSGAHAVHLAPAGPGGAGLGCSSCHQLPGGQVIEGDHGNGVAEVRFDSTRVAPGASYDPVSGVCAVACHDRGGARARPAWVERDPMGCGDCHGSPPSKHYPGGCSTCHQEASDDGAALLPGPFHRNDKVDLGDGSGGCGACHAEQPTSGAHRPHREPSLTTPVDCSGCHPTHMEVLSPGHLDGAIQLSFGERARFFGASPAWDGASCAGVACHGAGLASPSPVTPVWKDTSGAASQCGACHGVPPTQHTSSTNCGRADCHGGVVERKGGVPSIPPAGRLLHINGKLDVNR